MKINEINITNRNIKTFQNKLEYDQAAIIVSTPFKLVELENSFRFEDSFSNNIKKMNNLIVKASTKLKKGGMLFIYGTPNWLPYYAKNISDKTDLLFKYWIALDIANKKNSKRLNKSHLGVLMFVKGKKQKFNLNTKTVRIPYTACSHCKKNTKDWGGKKHLINKNGSAVSDVWKDFYKKVDQINDRYVEDLKLNLIDIHNKEVNVTDSEIPSIVKNRIINLVGPEKAITHINCKDLVIDMKLSENFNSTKQNKEYNAPNCGIYLGDCIYIMKKWVKEYPNGCFDLIFADPPYNLDKKYDKYSDAEKDEDYLQWCREWLLLCSKLLTPTGSLLVLNLPKWSIDHAVLLNKELYLQNWIVWDAMSTPKGKIMPAHYSLLYYTKSRNDYAYNPLIEGINSPEFCIRKSCINDRRKHGIDRKIELTDIWSDVHRIKHKKDRDQHPCQLPDSLMERIISLFSNENDYVFDPFSGAGTTPVIAKKMGRKYAAIDLSKDYVDIGNRKITELDQFGEVKKTSVKKVNYHITKKEIELYIQQISTKLGHKPTKAEFEDILSHDKNVRFNIDDILHLYSKTESALKSARIALINKG